MSDYMHRAGSGDQWYFEIDPSPAVGFERIYRELTVVPGVESVAGSSFGLLNSVVVPSTRVDVTATAGPRSASGGSALAIGIGRESTDLTDRRSLSAAYFLVTPGFFTAIKAALVDGRDFAATDIASSPWVAIVNESAANRFWPGQNPVGRRFTMPGSSDEQPREVIGVVRDIPLTVEGQVTPVVHTSYLQQPTRQLQPTTMFGQMMFMVRATGDPTSLLPSARRIVAAMDPDRPLSNIATMEWHLGSVMPIRGYVAFAIAAFALAATLLAAIGIYGVLAYSVSQRAREIGIRLALGARSYEVVMLIGRRALTILSIGLAAGLVVSLMLTRLLQSQLWKCGTNRSSDVCDRHDPVGHRRTGRVAHPHPACGRSESDRRAALRIARFTSAASSSRASGPCSCPS